MSNARAHRGIVTAVHDGFVYVWNQQTFGNELRFGHQPGIKPGSKVEYEWDRTLDWDAVQPGPIRLCDFPTNSRIIQHVTKEGVDKWTARTEVIFAPPDSEYAQELQAEVPWFQPPSQAQSEEEPPPQEPFPSAPQTHNGAAATASASNSAHVSEPVPGFADDYSDAPVDDLFTESSEERWCQGIVFAKTNTFLSIYVLNHGFKAHAFVIPGPEGFDPEVGTWLFFQIARQDEPIEDMDNAIYLAVDAQPIHPPPMPSAPAAFTTFVHGRVELRRHNPHVDGSYEGRNSVLGMVRVPGTQHIVYALNSGPEYVFPAAIVYDQVQSKWWAAAIAGGGRYKYLQGLPAALDALGPVIQDSQPLDLRPTLVPASASAPPSGQSYAQAARHATPPRSLAQLRNGPAAQPRPQPAAAVVERAPSTTDFRPPEGWNFRVERDKVFDLLGIAVGKKRGTGTIFRTRMGLVEVPAQCSLGTWVCMDASLDNGRPTNITRLRQLHPPISTRFIQQRSVMLAGYVRRQSDGLFFNDYLGRVYDPQRLLNADSEENVFAVELQLDDSDAPNVEREYRFFVVKNHTRLVNMQQPLVIPLELSAHSVEWGVSCQTEQADIKRYSEELQQRLGHTNAPDAENYAPDSAGTTSPILVLSDSEPDPAPILEHSDSQAPIIDLRTSQPFDEMPSTSAGPNAQSRALATINPTDYTYNLGEKTSYKAVFVMKKPTYALLYTKEYGLVIMNPAAMPNVDQDSFDRWCALGRWWQADFLPVQGFDATRHAFERICSGGQPCTTLLMPTKVEGDYVPDSTLPSIPHSLNDDAGLTLKVSVGDSYPLLYLSFQIFAECSFGEEQMARAEDGQLVVPSAMGQALMDRVLLEHMDLLNESVELWLQYIPEEHDCHWRVLGTDEYLARPPRPQAGAEDQLLWQPDPQLVTDTLQYLLYDAEETDSDEDGYEADDSSAVYVDTEVECVVDGDMPRRWEVPPAGTDSSFMPSAEDVAGGSAEMVDDEERPFYASGSAANAFFAQEVPIAGDSFFDDESASRAPTDPDMSPSALMNGSYDGPAYRFGFPRLPSRDISSPMNRLVSRADMESVAASGIHTTQNDLFRNDGFQQPTDAAQHGAAGPSWQLMDTGVAAPHSTAPTQPTDVNLFDALAAGEAAAPSQRVPDLLSFDLLDSGSAAGGSSDSQGPSGAVALSNAVNSAAAPCDFTPYTAASTQAATEQPGLIDWNALSSPERSALRRDIDAATGTNQQLMDEIARNNYQPGPSADDDASEDMPIDTAPHDGMAQLADDIEELKIRASHQLKSAVNRDFRRKTLNEMQQEQQKLRQIETRRASSRASSRASTAMGNGVRLPPLADMFAQPPVNDTSEDETGLEDTAQPRPTTIHQRAPIRPAQPAAARHDPFGGQAQHSTAQPSGGNMAKFDVPTTQPSRAPPRSTTRLRSEPPASGSNAVNATSANSNNVTSADTQPSDL
ncbi:hypothetical protein AAVH_19556 [Aphelenchoides avenae]|nr:hypothetical protein AAVH_19556 [Aphelenchus avenae]